MTRETLTTTEVVEVEESYTRCDGCGEEITDDQPSTQYKSAKSGDMPLDFHDECLDKLGVLTPEPSGLTWRSDYQSVILAMDSFDISLWTLGTGLVVAGIAIISSGVPHGVVLIMAGVLVSGTGWKFGRSQAQDAIEAYRKKSRWFRS